MLSKISQPGRAIWFSCAVAAVAATGCRSATPSWNLFGWNREPSAEALAGSGPSTTYPVPPSATATPQAIESVAAGVTTPSQTNPAADQIAGIEIDAGQPAETPAANSGAANLAAAQANGFYGGTQPSSYTTQPSSYTTEPAAAPSAPAAKVASRPSASTGGYGLGAPSMSLPGTSGSAAGGATAPAYDLPSLAGANSPMSATPTAPAAKQPSSTTTTAAPPSGYTLPPGLGTPSAEPSPAASTPSATIASSKSDRTGSVLPPDTSSNKPASYAPGSTSGSSGYPATSGGSVYR